MAPRPLPTIHRALPLLAMLACAPTVGADHPRPDPQRDTADLTPVARRVLALAAQGGRVTLADLPSLGGPPPPPETDVPATIRVWRRSEGSSSSCSGTVDVMNFDEYVRHVVPHEWYASWHEESLRSGAIAARSYAAWWVAAGGKYDCADVCDTSYTQNYGESTDERTDAAVADTSGVLAVNDDGIVFAEYSAENGDPTEYGVSEPHCTGEARYGHGRGLCQWGSQRWASEDGKTHDWIIAHYYPGASLLLSLDAARVDAEERIEMRSGQRETVVLQWQNSGGSTWRAGEMHLQTTDPNGRSSAFYDPDSWPAGYRPATLQADTPAGAVATFTVDLVAPEVHETQQWIEAFGLWSEPQGAWLGGDGGFQLLITVAPEDRDQPDGGGADSGAVDTGSGPRADGDRGAPAEGRGSVQRSTPEGGCQLTPSVRPIWALLALLIVIPRRRP